MKGFLHWLSRRRFPYEPLITVEISRSRILHNLNEFKRLAPGMAIAPVLKSNAYGHGLVEIAGILEHEYKAAASHSGDRIPFFAVDSYFEAVALRAKGFRTPLLVIGYTRPETMIESRLHNTAFAVTSMDTLERFAASEKRLPGIRIHLKIDTGMRRQGILPDEIDAAIAAIRAMSGATLEGIFTHFCDADNPDESFTEGQIAVWSAAIKRFKAAFAHIRYIHAAATDGSRLSSEIEGNVIRLGIGLYGLSENTVLNGMADLRPALEMKTMLTGVKKLKAGETVGYGNTYKAPKDALIATIPVGYYEGLDRRLSSGTGNEPRGAIQVQANGVERSGSRIACPIIGRVSMNITIIDVSGVPVPAVGMPVIAISSNGGDPNSIHSIAAACGTNTYEIAVGIPAQIKRVVVE